MNYSIPDNDLNHNVPLPVPPCGPLNPCFSETANTFYGLAFLLAAVFSFVGTTSTAVALFGDRLPEKSVGRYPALCSLQGMSFELCTTVSGSIISILCIARWHSFARPFKKVRKVLVLRVLTSAWIYTALPHIGVLFSVVIGLTDTRYKYHVAVASCNLVIHNVLPPWLESTLVISFAIIPTLLNSIIIPVTCSLVVREIVKQNLQHTYYAISSQTKEKGRWYKRSGRCTGSALTVAVVAIVFVSCQLPLWSWQYIDIIDSLVGTKVKERMSLRRKWNIDFILYIVLINLNSTLNPYLYYVRGSQYRRLLSQKLKKVAKTAADVISKVTARIYSSDWRKDRPQSLRNSNSSLRPEK
ncbi:hypothetical protein ACHWQZ_G014144 [Mnemiopsis leidyi]